MTTAAATRPSTGRRPSLWRQFRTEEARWAFIFLTPWIVGTAIFTIGPMIASLVISFTNMGLGKTFSFVGTKNFERLATDRNVQTALWNTFYYTIIHVPLAMAFALGLALLLLRVGRAAGLFRTVFYLPSITPLVAVGTLWLFLLNGQVGLVNRGLELIGLQGPQWTTDPGWAKNAIILMSLWSVGSTTVILFAALRNVPVELYEAARIDGANAWHSFRNVTLPLISGALFFVIVVNTIAALQMFDQVYTMFYGSQSGGAIGNSALFYVVYLFNRGFEDFQLGYASALAWLLFIIVMIITVIQLRLSKRWVYYEGGA